MSTYILHVIVCLLYANKAFTIYDRNQAFGHKYAFFITTNYKLTHFNKKNCDKENYLQTFILSLIPKTMLHLQ